MNDEQFRASLIECIELTNDLHFEESYLRLNELLSQARVERNQMREVQVLINLGLLYSTFKDYETALPYFFNAQDICENDPEIHYLNSIYNNIGILYSYKNNFDLAEEYFKKAYAISRKDKNLARTAINMINIASIKMELGQFDSAYFYNSEAIMIFRSMEKEEYISSAYSNLGDILIEQGEYGSALDYYRKAIALEKKYPDPVNGQLYLYQLARTHQELGNKDSTEHYLNKAILIFKEVSDFNLLSKAYLDYYELSNDKKYLDLSLNYKDSLLNRTNEEWISNQQISYELSIKTQEIQVLEERSKWQRWIIFGVSFISLNLILSIFVVWRSRVRRLRQQTIILRQEKRLHEIEQEKLKTDLEYKNKEVVSNTIHLMNKNEVLSSISSLLENMDGEAKSEIKDIIKNNLSQDADWEDFKLHFEKMHEGFLHELNTRHSGLTQTDIRLCAYLLLGLSAKEIANISNISPDSVRKRKQRLRQKLELDPSIELEHYLKSF